MPKTNFESVLEFYKAFQQEEYIAKDKAGYHNISEDRLKLKLELIAEEFIELVEAVYGADSSKALTAGWESAKEKDTKNRDIVETADALADLVYVINGLAIETGIPFDEVFAEVQASNMSKLDDNGNPVISDGVTPAIDGKVKPFGKIIKSKNFFEPRIKEVLEKTVIKFS